MTAPFLRGQGAANGGTASFTPSAPNAVPPSATGQNAGDIIIYILETANETVGSISGGDPPSGFAHVPGSPIGVGTPGGTDATMLNVYWRRATADAETMPASGDAGNHQVGRCYSIAGCIASGNPVDASASDTTATAQTAFTIPGITTTVPECFVIDIVSNGEDGPCGVTSVTNASLSTFTQQPESSNTGGNGGTFTMMWGIKTAAGAVDATTGTLDHVPPGGQARIKFALKPVAGGGSAAVIAAYNQQLRAEL